MIGDLISGGLRLLGGFMGQSSQDKAVAAQREMAAQNIALQKEFAQSGIRWKVADAKKAGIHPLYALGAQTTSFSPVSIGTPSNSPVGEALGAMGADVSRAVNATRTGRERNDAFTRSAAMLDLEGRSLDNDIKRATLASAVQRIKQNANPPMPEASNFSVPMGKVGDRPPIMLGDTRIVTDPKTSSMKDVQDRWGDEGPPQWAVSPYVMWRDYVATSNNYEDNLRSNPFDSGRRRGGPVRRWWLDHLDSRR